MESMSVAKTELAQLPTTAFTVLSDEFTRRILERMETSRGMYRLYSLEFLEEGEPEQESAPESKKPYPAPVLNIDLTLLLQTLREQNAKDKQKSSAATERIVERLVELRMREGKAQRQSPRQQSIFSTGIKTVLKPDSRAASVYTPRELTRTVTETIYRNREKVEAAKRGVSTSGGAIKPLTKKELSFDAALKEAQSRGLTYGGGSQTSRTQFFRETVAAAKKAAASSHIPAFVTAEQRVFAVSAEDKASIAAERGIIGSEAMTGEAFRSRMPPEFSAKAAFATGVGSEAAFRAGEPELSYLEESTEQASIQAQSGERSSAAAAAAKIGDAISEGIAKLTASKLQESASVAGTAAKTGVSKSAELPTSSAASKAAPGSAESVNSAVGKSSAAEASGTAAVIPDSERVTAANRERAVGRIAQTSVSDSAVEAEQRITAAQSAAVSAEKTETAKRESTAYRGSLASPSANAAASTDESAARADEHGNGATDGIAFRNGAVSASESRESAEWEPTGGVYADTDTYGVLPTEPQGLTVAEQSPVGRAFASVPTELDYLEDEAASGESGTKKSENSAESRAIASEIARKLARSGEGLSSSEPEERTVPARHEAATAEAQTLREAASAASSARQETVPTGTPGQGVAAAAQTATGKTGTGGLQSRVLQSEKSTASAEGHPDRADAIPPIALTARELRTVMSVGRMLSRTRGDMRTLRTGDEKSLPERREAFTGVLEPTAADVPVLPADVEYMAQEQGESSASEHREAKMSAAAEPDIKRIVSAEVEAAEQKAAKGAVTDNRALPHGESELAGTARQTGNAADIRTAREMTVRTQSIAEPFTGVLEIGSEPLRTAPADVEYMSQEQGESSASERQTVKKDSVAETAVRRPIPAEVEAGDKKTAYSADAENRALSQADAARQTGYAADIRTAPEMAVKTQTFAEPFTGVLETGSEPLRTAPVDIEYLEAASEQQTAGSKTAQTTESRRTGHMQRTPITAAREAEQRRTPADHSATEKSTRLEEQKRGSRRAAKYAPLSAEQIQMASVLSRLTLTGYRLRGAAIGGSPIAAADGQTATKAGSVSGLHGAAGEQSVLHGQPQGIRGTLPMARGIGAAESYRAQWDVSPAETDYLMPGETASAAAAKSNENTASKPGAAAASRTQAVSGAQPGASVRQGYMSRRIGAAASPAPGVYGEQSAAPEQFRGILEKLSRQRSTPGFWPGQSQLELAPQTAARESDYTAPPVPGAPDPERQYTGKAPHAGAQSGHIGGAMIGQTGKAAAHAGYPRADLQVAEFPAGLAQQSADMTQAGRMAPPLAAHSAESMIAKQGGDMAVIERMSAPQPQNLTVWSNPYMSSAPQTTHREKNKPEQKKTQEPEKVTNVRMSEAEIRRTADRVYQLIDERIRRERRRIGL